MWRAADVAADRQWSVELDDGQRAAIVEAARRAAARGHTVRTLTAEEFALPDLGTAIAAWSDMLEHGRGFVLLRNFPIDQLTEHEIAIPRAARSATRQRVMRQDFDPHAGHFR